MWFVSTNTTNPHWFTLKNTLIFPVYILNAHFLCHINFRSHLSYDDVFSSFNLQIVLLKLWSLKQYGVENRRWFSKVDQNFSNVLNYLLIGGVKSTSGYTKTKSDVSKGGLKECQVISTGLANFVMCRGVGGYCLQQFGLVEIQHDPLFQQEISHSQRCLKYTVDVSPNRIRVLSHRT